MKILKKHVGCMVMVQWSDAPNEEGLLVDCGSASGFGVSTVYLYNRGKNKLVEVEKDQIVAISEEKVIFPAYKLDKKNIILIQG